MSKQSIPATDEVWDKRALGADEEFAEVADEKLEAAADEASGTLLISIRVQKTMLDDFKIIASLNGGIGYQTLMKQIMQRFVDGEKKRIFRELALEKLKTQNKSNPVTQPARRSAKQRKLA